MPLKSLKHDVNNYIVIYKKPTQRKPDGLFVPIVVRKQLLQSGLEQTLRRINCLPYNEQ